jgi:hypothetical protein
MNTIVQQYFIGIIRVQQTCKQVKLDQFWDPRRLLITKTTGNYEFMHQSLISFLKLLTWQKNVVFDILCIVAI